MADNNLTLQDLLVKYKNEFNDDNHIDEMNLRDKQLMLPGIKHKYVAYLIQHKQKKYELERLKKQALKELINQNAPDIGLSKHAMESKFENNPAVQRINNMIKEQDILIDYLEKIETITKSMTYDISNVIKIMELETT